jgi:hypothetical protein
LFWGALISSSQSTKKWWHLRAWGGSSPFLFYHQESSLACLNDGQNPPPARMLGWSQQLSRFLSIGLVGRFWQWPRSLPDGLVGTDLSHHRNLPSPWTSKEVLTMAKVPPWQARGEGP